MSRELVQGLKFRQSHKRFDVEGLTKALETGYLAQRRGNGFKIKKSFAPSSVGYGSGTCPRFWFYAFNGAEFNETADAYAIANMSYGTEAHKRIQGLFKEAGILKGEEIEILHEDPPIRGYMDVLIEWQDESVPGEIKTTTEQSFLWKHNSMEAPMYNLIQILIYMKVLKKDKGFLLYENKNTQEFLIIPVYMDEKNTKLVDYLFDWMRETYKNAKEGELPKRPFNPKSKECKSCPVWDTCWASGKQNDEGKIELPVLQLTGGRG